MTLTKSVKVYRRNLAASQRQSLFLHLSELTPLVSPLSFPYSPLSSVLPTLLRTSPAPSQISLCPSRNPSRREGALHSSAQGYAPCVTDICMDIRTRSQAPLSSSLFLDNSSHMLLPTLASVDAKIYQC